MEQEKKALRTAKVPFVNFHDDNRATMTSYVMRAVKFHDTNWGRLKKFFDYHGANFSIHDDDDARAYILTSNIRKMQS